MSGLPDVEQIRSISKFGISVVTIVFQEGTDIYWARQLVGERLAARRRGDPAGLRHADARADRHGAGRGLPVPGQGDHGVGRHADGAADDPRLVRRLPAARACPGVTEINAHGGELKTYQVELDPDQLATYRLVDDRRLRRAADQQRQRRRRLPRPRGRGPVHPRREPGARRRGHRGDRHRRAQRRAGHDRRRGQGPPRADDPRGAGHPRRPGRDRHRAGDDAHRRELAARSSTGVKARDRRAPEEPAAGRDDRAALRPHPPDRPDARARCCTTWSRGRAGHRGPAGPAGQPAGRPDRGAGDPAVDALRGQRDARHRASRPA